MNPPKRLGISRDFLFGPATHALQDDARFVLVRDAVATNAVRLRTHRLDAAMLGPIDYAREASLYSIVRGVAVSSRSSNRSVVVYMRKGVRRIGSLAADPSSNSEIVLAKIVLKEEFSLDVVIVPVIAPLETMLAKADAALVSGDQALSELPGHPEALDLVESWVAMTGLPYVHGVWCVEEGALAPEDTAPLQHAASEAESRIGRIVAENQNSDAPLLRVPDDLAAYLQSFSYNLTEEAEDGLSEYLRYAYYHGILADVPDLRFLPPKIESDQKDG